MRLILILYLLHFFSDGAGKETMRNPNGNNRQYHQVGTDRRDLTPKLKDWNDKSREQMEEQLAQGREVIRTMSRIGE